jgi:endonuclease YncB( thermonuclease family)
VHNAALTCLALLALAGASTASETITRTIVAVADGDTVTVLTLGKQQVRVRLAEIDAPEKNRPFGAKAEQMLGQITFGKEVSVGYDRNHRTMGRILSGIDRS